ncbi:MAG: polyprenyl synthetase family protein, partial [Armatimonadota bacterium]
LEGKADAILGVACLDSLEKSFDRISDLGIPHQAIPLLTDGCEDTLAEVDRVRETLSALSAGGLTVQRSYLPLLRATHTIFEPAALDCLVVGCTCPPRGDAASEGAMAATDAIARDWLGTGGKRLRPFITLAAYAVGKYGTAALSPTAQLTDLLPPAIQRISVAIEALHKASLVHDDIEDRDASRYGRPTIHREHGVDTAINVGDYLVGLGYKLIADQATEFGAEVIVAILQRLSAAHLQLCCGQGTELLWDRELQAQLRPVHALHIGALKTAPAFEVALYAGLRAAGVDIPEAALKQFASYIGEGYQVLDDLEDWEEAGSHRQAVGRDFVAGRPTILQAFALEAGGAEELAALAHEGHLQEDATTVIDRVREVYERRGAFEKADLLYARLRQRAFELAGELGDPAIQELLRFLVRNILRKRFAANPHHKA